MDYGQLSRDLVADAIANKMPGLNTTVVFHWLTAQGDYDADAGEYEDTTVNSDPIPVVAARPTFEEVQDGRAVATDVKLIVPGKLLDREIDDDTTATLAGKKFTCFKGKGVPGGSVVIVFLRTN